MKRKCGGCLIQKPPALLRAPSYSRKAHGVHLSVTTYMGSANADGKISLVDVGENETATRFTDREKEMLVDTSKPGRETLVE
ncbi:hypothetical protein L6452_09466 [Arctium lappa]|uniref:Uncharacterized protein n=1 Tax=Arctium lappa TaxID=4217 RepID=A0ACB9DK35_ARCLA|nr:hypothetical protein L6452_09466 [Arctium lappa]